MTTCRNYGTLQHPTEVIYSSSKPSVTLQCIPSRRRTRLSLDFVSPLDGRGKRAKRTKCVDDLFCFKPRSRWCAHKDPAVCHLISENLRRGSIHIPQLQGARGVSFIACGAGRGNTTERRKSALLSGAASVRGTSHRSFGYTVGGGGLVQH